MYLPLLCAWDEGCCGFHNAMFLQGVKSRDGFDLYRVNKIQNNLNNVL